MLLGRVTLGGKLPAQQRAQIMRVALCTHNGAGRMSAMPKRLIAAKLIWIN
jgi:hypothetical protein